MRAITSNARAENAERMAKIIKLRRQGLSHAAIAQLVGVGRMTIQRALDNEDEPARFSNDPRESYAALAELEARLTANGRCRCGLLRPCLRCTPTSAAALADSRPGCGLTYPEGGP